MLSWKKKGGGIKLRVQEKFALAPEELWIALAHYILNEDGPSGRMLDDYIQEHIAGRVSKPTRVNAIGRHHDLLQLFDELNKRFFHRRCNVEISWGKNSTLKGRARSRSSIQLGADYPGEKLIRIHPCLDQQFVPNYYVAWVIYHEMLHEVLGVDEVNGRRQVHSPEFRVLEESYPDYEQCKEWEGKNLNRLLKFRGH